MRCAVAGCNTDNKSKSHNKDLKFIRFPSDITFTKLWVNACKRKQKVNTINSRVCSKHFDKNDYERNLRHELLGYSARGRRLLKADAIPSLHMPNKAEVSKESEDRCNRVAIRNRKKLVESILQANVKIKKKRNDKQLVPSPLQPNVKSDDVKIKIEFVEIPDISTTLVEAEMAPPTDESTRVNTEYQDVKDQARIISQLKEEIRILKNEKSALEAILTTEQIRKLREGRK